jgi:hypothetical protein
VDLVDGDVAARRAEAELRAGTTPTGSAWTSPRASSKSTSTITAPSGSEVPCRTNRIVGWPRPTQMDGDVATPPAGSESDRSSPVRWSSSRVWLPWTTSAPPSSTQSFVEPSKVPAGSGV